METSIPYVIRALFPVREVQLETTRVKEEVLRDLSSKGKVNGDMFDLPPGNLFSFRRYARVHGKAMAAEGATRVSAQIFPSARIVFMFYFILFLQVAVCVIAGIASYRSELSGEEMGRMIGMISIFNVLALLIGRVAYGVSRDRQLTRLESLVRKLEED